MAAVIPNNLERKMSSRYSLWRSYSQRKRPLESKSSGDSLNKGKFET